MDMLNELMIKYKSIKSIPLEEEAKKIKALFLFEKELLSKSSPDVIDFHFSCLSDHSDWKVYLFCRAAFIKRGVTVELYLLDRLAREDDSHIIGDIIHILGRLRSSVALPTALKYINEKDAYVKEVCLYVIGWVGALDNLPVLNNHLLNSESPLLRITAGSAMRQLYWRCEDVKEHVLKCLSCAFFTEKNNDVKLRLIELISTITKKNLGVREDKNNPNNLLGDLDKAIEKTNKFLALTGFDS